MIPIKLNGMENKARAENIPEGMARLAVNVQFTNNGNIKFPRQGYTSLYSGDCKWAYKGTINLFVEGDSLKRLNDDYTATVLQSGIGSSRVFYAEVADTIYWNNDVSSGKIRNGVNSEWGVARPQRQPTCTAVPLGGMFAGEYRVAITYLGTDGSEGGTGMGKRVIVAEGGGLHLNNFPIPPSYCTGVRIYVSSVNSKDMYLYAEYASTIADVTLTKRICTIPLDTQFAYSPSPRGRIVVHGGRIYYAFGDKVYYTEPHNYGLQRAFKFMRFDSTVKIVISSPPSMFVNSEKQLGHITNLDAPDGSPPQIAFIQEGGAVAGSEASDPYGGLDYFMSDRGFVRVTPQGKELLSYKNVAIPFFDTGCCNVTERDGLKYLVFVGQGQTSNPLANAEYIASESIRTA